MKRIGLTMRSDYIPETEEYRDSIDRRWYDFLSMCNIQPVLIPNSIFDSHYIEQSNLSGFILSGGNTLGDVPQRDILESQLIEFSIINKLPVLGVCRGMQVIQHYFRVSLYTIQNHVAQRHDLNFNGVKINVNSYHNYGTHDSNEHLVVDAKANDDIVEAVSHQNLPIRGIMWHPEREIKFAGFDINMFTNHFQS